MEWGTYWVKHKPRYSLRGQAGWGAALQCIQLEEAVWGHFQIDQNLFQGILVALRGDQDHRVGSFDILDTSPKAILDSQAEWSGGLVGSSTSRG